MLLSLKISFIHWTGPDIPSRPHGTSLDPPSKYTVLCVSSCSSYILANGPQGNLLISFTPPGHHTWADSLLITFDLPPSTFRATLHDPSPSSNRLPIKSLHWLISARRRPTRCFPFIPFFRTRRKRLQPSNRFFKWYRLPLLRLILTVEWRQWE